ncbi:MAG: penicillin-binding protein activator [Pelagibacteraceae bacterium TMED232]|nr:MAG: penicillin-binding protein activator [Pelagibacteraceae bacterium TMED232]
MIKISKLLISLLLVFIIITPQKTLANEKLKIGLLIPLSEDNQEIGQQIIKTVRMAINDINNENIEIIVKDTKSNPNFTLKSAIELKNENVKIVIGPVFYQNLVNLDEVEDLIFLSLTNRTIGLPKNVISAGVNSTSQLNAIKKFLELNEIKKTIFLLPELKYEAEIKKGLKNSKLKTKKIFEYDTEPTKLTKQIEKITNYRIRKQNLEDEIKRLEQSDDPNKEKKIKHLEKRYTLGKVNFDSVVIADFDESLKSVATSLLYSDVSPDKEYFISLNQWFNESLIQEESLQPMYYPSINKKNWENYKDLFYKKFKKYPNHLSLLSYDLVGLIYYLSFKNNFLTTDIEKLFKDESSFKGKIGIFDIKNNEINHRLNFYKIEKNQTTEIF